MGEIKLATGARFTIADPSPERLSFPEILHHLGLQVAHAGATLKPLWMTQRAALLSVLAEKAAQAACSDWRTERSPGWRLARHCALVGFLWRDHVAIHGDPPVAVPELDGMRRAIVRARFERYGLAWPPMQAALQIVERCDAVVEALIERELGTGATIYGDFPVALVTPDRERAERIYVSRFVRLGYPTSDVVAYWCADREAAASWLKCRQGVDLDCFGGMIHGGVTAPLHRADVEALGQWLETNVIGRPNRAAAE
jgi:hypothetical protein